MGRVNSCVDEVNCFGPTRRAAQTEYRREIDALFGYVIESPWVELRRGLVLGGEALWGTVLGLIGQAEGYEEIRWRPNA